MSIGQLQINVIGALIEGSLPRDADATVQRRRLITDALTTAVEEAVIELAPPLIVEIGANDASFSVNIKRALPTSRVVALEANPAVFPKLSVAPLAAGVEYLPLCMSDREGETDFLVPIYKGKPSRTMGSLLTDRKAEGFVTSKVPTTTLDKFLGKGSDPVALWIDVEGAIGTVLAGAAQTLGRCVLLYAELEDVPRWDGQLKSGEVIDLLSGYGLHPIARDVQRSKWQFNCLFIRDQIAERPEIVHLLERYTSFLADRDV